MPIDFRNSETKDNLMRAFAGESQARNRYTFAASQAKKDGLHVIEAVFTFTANQEKEHAEIFYNHLKELAGETIVVDGGYPVDIYPDIKQLLLSAQHNEYEEYDPIYKAFGDKAAEEGFSRVAASFHMISAIEKTHGDRFGKFAQLMEQNRLFCFRCGNRLDLLKLRLCIHRYKCAGKMPGLRSRQRLFYPRFHGSLQRIGRP